MAGILIANSVPWLISDFTEIVPLCFSIMLLLMNKPSPVPLPASFVVKKASKRLVCFSFGLLPLDPSVFPLTFPPASDPDSCSDLD